MTEEIRIPNIENYIQEIINGELILTPKKKYITEEEIILTPKKEYITEEELYMIPLKSFIYSKIEKCTMKKDNKIISRSEKYRGYRGILIDIWKSMPAQKILQKSTYNFKLTNENGHNGYKWCNCIKMSFQNKEAPEAVKEILNMIKVNNLSIDISIILNSGRTIYYKKD